MEMEASSHTKCSSTALTVLVSPVRKSARTHKSPLRNYEFVSSLPHITQKHSEHGAASAEKQTPEKFSMPSQHSEKSSEKKTLKNLSPNLSAEEFKRKRGRPRKNSAMVNNKSGVPVQLGMAGTWSLLNSKAAGDSSLGSIGLVSELFSVAPAHLSDSVSQLAKAPSPVADLSFSIDELGPKKKRKRKKKKKKSRHSSIADIEDASKDASSDLEDLVQALQKLEMVCVDAAVGQAAKRLELTSVDGHKVLADIFSKTCHKADFKCSFVVRKKMTRSTVRCVATASGNRQKTAGKASPLVGGSADAKKQSCLPPKKRHVMHIVDVSGAPGIGHRKRGRGRPPKLRPGQKPDAKTSKFCSEFSFIVCLLLYPAYCLK